MVDEQTKIWAAGAFDGEGCAVILKRPAGKGGLRSDAYQIIIKVTNTDCELLRPYTVNWDAKFRVDKNTKNRQNIHIRDAYIAEFDRPTAIQFLKDIIPYLKVRQSRAVIVLRAIYAQEKYIKQCGSTRGSSSVLAPFYILLEELDRETASQQAQLAEELLVNP